jgi:branched-subunit amino acid transport protein
MNPETGNIAYDAWLWLTFILIGLATTLPRASFIVLGNRVVLPSVVQRALRYAPAAALAAIVAPDVLMVAGDFAPLNPNLAAALAAIAAATLSRNPWLPFIAGMGALLALRLGLGW